MEGKDLVTYKIAKIIAESDSISEGYAYCPKYTKAMYKKEIKDGGDTYVEVAKQILKVRIR